MMTGTGTSFQNGLIRKEIHDQIDVFLIPEKREGLLQVVTPQGGVTDHMKVMEFQEVETGAGHRIRHGKPFIAAFPGKSENEMRAEIDAAITSAVDGIEPALKVMAAIDPLQGAVVDGLQTVFQSYKVLPGQALEPADLFRVHAVRARPYGEADYFGMIQGAFVEWNQGFERGIRVRERLKIDNKLLRPVPAFQICDACADLLGYWLQPVDRLGPKGIVVTVSATADGDRAVAVRTGESRVDDHLVNPAAKPFPEKGAIAIVARSPGERPRPPCQLKLRFHAPRL